MEPISYGRNELTGILGTCSSTPKPKHSEVMTPSIWLIMKKRAKDIQQYVLLNMCVRNNESLRHKNYVFVRDNFLFITYLLLFINMFAFDFCQHLLQY